MRILISGASVAGPVLAYWLTRHGFSATVVEHAPALRKTGGHAVGLFQPAMNVTEKTIDDYPPSPTASGRRVGLTSDPGSGLGNGPCLHESDHALSNRYTTPGTRRAEYRIFTGMRRNAF
jgi:glycine/D-amino acid oxidase-like deaminating enzyme